MDPTIVLAFLLGKQFGLRENDKGKSKFDKDDDFEYGEYDYTVEYAALASLTSIPVFIGLAHLDFIFKAPVLACALLYAGPFLCFLSVLVLEMKFELSEWTRGTWSWAFGVSGVISSTLALLAFGGYFAAVPKLISMWLLPLPPAVFVLVSIVLTGLRNGRRAN